MHNSGLDVEKGIKCKRIQQYISAILYGLSGSFNWHRVAEM